MALKRIIIPIVCSVWILVPPALGLAATCKLQAVGKPEDAKHRVYFTKFLKEDTTNGRYKGCKIVRRPDKDTETFFVTPFRQDATIIVHRDNWPG